MIGFILCAAVATGGPTLDVRVDGAGLLRFARDGRAVYAKSAHLTVDAGCLGLSGNTLLPQVRVPSDATDLSVDLQGDLFATAHGSKIPLGQLVLAMFPVEGALTPDGGFLVAADRPTLVEPGDGLAGVIRGPQASTPTIVAKAQPTAKTPEIKRVVAPYRTIAPTAVITTGKASVTAKQFSEVGGDKILLGEIADIEGDSFLVEKLKTLEVGDSPAIGVTRGVDRFSIQTRLLQAGLKDGSVTLSVPEGTKVLRKSQSISADKFVAAALDAAQKKAPGASFHCDQPGSDFPAPLGEVRLAVETCSVGRTSAAVTVGVLIDGKRINSRTVNLKMDGNAPGVAPGDAVKIILKAGGATVEITGKARSGGFVGQTIEVVADTGAKLTATVAGPGRVEVQM